MERDARKSLDFPLSYTISPDSHQSQRWGRGQPQWDWGVAHCSCSQSYLKKGEIKVSRRSMGDIYLFSHTSSPGLTSKKKLLRSIYLINVFQHSTCPLGHLSSEAVSGFAVFIAFFPQTSHKVSGNSCWLKRWIRPSVSTKSGKWLYSLREEISFNCLVRWDSSLGADLGYWRRTKNTTADSDRHQEEKQVQKNSLNQQAICHL